MAIFIIASKSRSEGLSPELCCDLAELMISPDEDVESAGVPSDLRVITLFISDVSGTQNLQKNLKPELNPKNCKTAGKPDGFHSFKS